MTGHPTDDTPRAGYPASKDDGMDGDGLHRDGLHRDGPDRDRADFTGAGITGTDAEGDAGGDAELDAVLSAATGNILAALQTAIDLDAGLAALHNGTPQGTRSGPSGETRTTASSTGGRTGSAFPAGGDGELDAVCQLLGGLLLDLEPLADPAGSVPGAIAGSFAAVYRLLEELRTGLAQRRLDRDTADRLARLAVHNATETRHLLSEERHRTVRAGRRGRIDAWIATAAGTRDAVGALRPRIRRLFDDAEDTAPHHPAPRLPV